MVTRFDWSQQRLEDRRLLELRYSEPHRAYHDINHPEIVYGYCQEIWQSYFGNQDPLAKFPAEFFQTACAWHDAIYVVGSKTNEEDSAALYERSSTARFQNPYAQRAVIDAIRASGDHWASKNAQLNNAIKVFLDADIFELSADWELFNHNSNMVMKEFCSKFTPQEVLEGRKKWFESLRDKTRIYWICTDRDDLARENIERGIKHCESTLKTLERKAKNAIIAKTVDQRDF